MEVGRVRIVLLLFASQNVTRYNQKSLICSAFLVVTKKGKIFNNENFILEKRLFIFEENCCFAKCTKSKCFSSTLVEESNIRYTSIYTDLLISILYIAADTLSHKEHFYMHNRHCTIDFNI